MILPEGRDMSSGIIETKQINQLGEEIRPPLLCIEYMITFWDHPGHQKLWPFSFCLF